MPRELFGRWQLVFSLFACLLLAMASGVSQAAPPAKPAAQSSKASKPPPPSAAKPKAAKPKAAKAKAKKKSTKPKAAKPKAAKSKKKSAKSKSKTPILDASRRESEIYGERLDGLQSEVDDLKDRIFRSKARLSLLKETVLHGVLAGSRVIIAHRNLMSAQYRLTKISVYLDGAQIYARTDGSDTGGALDQEDEIVVFDGNLVPGPHELTIELSYRGNGFGVFAYLNGYTFESRSSHSFSAPQNGAVRILSSGFERGNLTTEMKDRPAVDWQETALDASGKPMPRAGDRRSRRKAKKNAGAEMKVGGSSSPKKDKKSKKNKKSKKKAKKKASSSKKKSQ